MEFDLAGQTCAGPWSRAEARDFDRRAQESLGVAGELLMENAGAAVARSAARLAAARGCGRLVVLCGPGNNGGDGFVAARHALHSFPLEVFLLGDRSRVRGDALANLRRLEALGIAARALDPIEPLRASLATGGALVVDALFGIGLDRPLEGVPRAVVEEANRSGAPILAVDIPSGIDADTGEVLGAAIRAAATITFVAPKVGFRRGRGFEHAGVVEIVGIGVPAFLSPRVP